jgi:hypothetical protein
MTSMPADFRRAACAPRKQAPHPGLGSTQRMPRPFRPAMMVSSEASGRRPAWPRNSSATKSRRCGRIHVSGHHEAVRRDQANRPLQGAYQGNLARCAADKRLADSGGLPQWQICGVRAR